MSRKWLEKEGSLWIDKQIITKEQLQEIIELYPEKKRVVGILPLLGSILIGLSVLSFIASNWSEIPSLVRLGILAIALVAFYSSGDIVIRKGSPKIGVALIGIGLMIFGASIFLLGQMFHLITYDARAFIIWGLAGIGLIYMIHSRFLFLLTLLIINIAQIYSITTFDQFSFGSFLLLLVGLGIAWWRYPSAFLSWWMSLSITLHGFLFIVFQDWSFVWFYILLMVLYVVGDWLKRKTVTLPLQNVTQMVAYALSIFFVFMLSEIGWFTEDLPNPWLFIILSVGIFILSLIAKIKFQRVLSLFEWVLFLPLFYIAWGEGFLYLIVLFSYSGYLLWMGYREEWRFKVTLGTILFLISTLIGYVQLAWDFMPKSLFFLIGGLILFALSWYLEGKRRRFINGQQNNQYGYKLGNGEGGKKE